MPKRQPKSAQQTNEGDNFVGFIIHPGAVWVCAAYSFADYSPNQLANRMPILEPIFTAQRWTQDIRPLTAEDWIWRNWTRQNKGMLKKTHIPSNTSQFDASAIMQSVVSSSGSELPREYTTPHEEDQT